jgi:hypothetical protein
MTDGDEQGKRPSDGVKVHTADTVPPPASGDAYNAATEVRQAPDDLLEIMRQRKELRAAKMPKFDATPNIIIEVEHDDMAPPEAPAPIAAPAAVEPVPTPAAPPPLDPVAPPPAPIAAMTPAVAPTEDGPIEYPGTIQRQRNRSTAVAVITILVVVAVILALMTVVLGVRSGPAGG